MTNTKDHPQCPWCGREACPWLLQVHYLEPGEHFLAEKCPFYGKPRPSRARSAVPMPAAFDLEGLEAALKVPEGVDLLKWASLAGEGMSVVERTADGFLRLPGGQWGERVEELKSPKAYPDEKGYWKGSFVGGPMHPVPVVYAYGLSTGKLVAARVAGAKVFHIDVQDPRWTWSQGLGGKAVRYEEVYEGDEGDPE